MTTTSAPRRRVDAGLIGAAGTLLVLAYAVFAVLQIQVLNPLATMPGSTLGEIRAAVGRTGDSMDHSPWGNLLHAISLASLGALMVLGAVSVLSGLRRTAQLSATPRPAEIADPRPAERSTER